MKWMWNSVPVVLICASLLVLSAGCSKTGRRTAAVAGVGVAAGAAAADKAGDRKAEFDDSDKKREIEKKMEE